LFSGIALVFLFNKFSLNAWSTILACSILAFSRAFIDYSTSGLENPLSHFIIILFFIKFFQSSEIKDDKHLLLLSLIASFGLINRMDLFLVFLPPLLIELLNFGNFKGIKYILLGQLPFIFWELFSLIYYGYFVPNTAFAKLAHGISRLVILNQGLTYFYNSIINDPLTILVIILGIIIPFLTNGKKRKSLAISASIFLYVIYTFWIGGDFMSGRFFSVPLIMSCISLLNAIPEFSNEQVQFLIGIILILGLSLPFNTLSLDIKEYTFNDNRIDDERMYFFPGMSLITRYRNQMQPDFKWKDQGIDYRDSGIRVTHAWAIGMFGYYCGPKIHIIDGFSLADPLLSHLKTNNPNELLKIGHVFKDLPEGYRESLANGVNLITDPGIHEYYDKVMIITRGKFSNFTWERFNTILKMNLGQYDYLIE